MNTVILHSLTNRLTKSQPAAFIITAMFALHPLNASPVSWISARKDLLAALFGFAALNCYCRYYFTAKLRWYSLSIASLTLSLMSKGTFISFPILLIILEYWFRTASPRQVHPPLTAVTLQRALLRYSPFLVLAVVSVIVNYFAQVHVEAIVKTKDLEHISAYVESHYRQLCS